MPSDMLRLVLSGTQVSKRRRMGHIFFATPPRPHCCAKALHCRSSGRCCATGRRPSGERVRKIWFEVRKAKGWTDKAAEPAPRQKEWQKVRSKSVGSDSTDPFTDDDEDEVILTGLD